MRAWALGAMALSLAGCSGGDGKAPGQGSGKTATVAVAPIDATVAPASPGDARRDALAPVDGVEGSWSLIAIDGETLAQIDGRPLGRIHIGPRSAGGSGGCNSGGGPALVVGDRLMMPSVVATEMGCARELLDRDRAVSDTLTALPRLAVEDGGRSLTVTGPRHRLRFVRSKNWQSVDPVPVTGLSDKTITLERVDAARASTWDSSITLRFSADQVTFSSPGCAPATGTWQANGDRVTFAIKNAPSCATDLGTRALVAGVPTWRWLIDVNNEAILATGDHMISGRATPRR